MSDFLITLADDPNPSIELYHHGIKGQKWGVRRYQNPDGSLTQAGKERYLKGGSDIKMLLSKSDRAYNLEKWGKDRAHNLLAVTGVSGSGKTTLATTIASATGADLLSLDIYWDNPQLDGHMRSKEFDEYLKKNVPEYFTKIAKDFESYDMSRFDPNDEHGKEYWAIMDKVRDSMLQYSKDCYGKHKVVAEGVQWLDSTLYPNPEEKEKAIKNMPMITRDTGVIKSTIRRLLRDKGPYNIQEIANIVNGQMVWSSQIKNIGRMVTQDAKDFVQDKI